MERSKLRGQIGSPRRTGGEIVARVMPPEAAPPIEAGAADAQDRLESQTQAIFAHRPESQRLLGELLSSFGAGATGTLPPRLLELCRLRIAFWNQCRSCMSLRYMPDIVDEDLVCSLERPEEGDDLSDAEKAALRYADLLASNHLAIDESVYADLREHFDEGQIVELGMYRASRTRPSPLGAAGRCAEPCSPPTPNRAPLTTRCRPSRSVTSRIRGRPRAG
jgi:alkylhydroperoxidase family enzyme